MITLKNINKTYIKDNEKITVLKDLNVNFEKGKLYLIKGVSGSGKSTLINILGLLDTCDGEYLLDNKIINKLNDQELSEIRKNNIGMIFQNHYLNPRLTAKENILIASYLNDLDEEENNKNIINYFNKLGIENRMNHYSKELSGGEKARVAIIRALINNPTYILADEPTGNLDYNNTINIYEILKNLVVDGKCVIMVSHDDLANDYANIIYELIDGKLIKKTNGE